MKRNGLVSWSTCWTLVALIQVFWFAAWWNQSRATLMMLLPAIATQQTTNTRSNDLADIRAVPGDSIELPPTFEIVLTILHDQNQSKRSGRSEAADWLLLPEVQDIPVTICSPDQLRRRNETNKASFAFRPEDAFSYLLKSNRTGKVTILPIVNGFRAGEAPGYLTYILNNWHSLPDVIIFLHGSPTVHNPNILTHIRRIVAGDGQNTNTSWTPQQIGFLNLNEGPMVCRRANGPPATPEDEWPLQWALMGFDQKSFPGRIKTPCCAQFMVTKERIRLRTKWFYQQALKVVYEFRDGGFLEHFWHIVWGEQAILSGDRELRSYFLSEWTKPIQDAVLHKPYINVFPLQLSESMKIWYEVYKANPEAYYPVVTSHRSSCGGTKFRYCYDERKNC